MVEQEAGADCGDRCGCSGGGVLGAHDDHDDGEVDVRVELVSSLIAVQCWQTSVAACQ
jgi:hypothetical protein